MAKSLGEINYEYLVEFFGSAEGREGFFTSDDDEEVLVFPAEARASFPAESRTGPIESVPAHAGRAEGAQHERPGVSLFRETSAVVRLLRDIAAFGSALVRRMRRKA
jgi:hypothetical protein